MDEGGTLAPGASFDFINEHSTEATVGGCGNFLTASSYPVPGGTPSSPGTYPAQVKTTVKNGEEYPYDVIRAGKRKRTNPTIKIESK